MNSAIFVALPTLAFSGALMFLLPYMSPLRYFFSITVPPDFHSTGAARATVRRYHLQILIVVALTIAAAWAIAPSFPELAVMLSFLLPMIGGMFCYLRARNDVRQYAIAQPPIREAQLSTEPDHLPRWIALALPPFAAPLATAAYLRARWEQIPERFPVHFDLAGNPNRWAEKSAGGVYTPLLIEAGLMLFILLLSFAMFYGSRRGPQRLAVLQVEVAVMYLLAWVFTAVALMPIAHIPVAVWIVPNVLFVVGVIIWCVRMARNPHMPVDNTPDEYWHLGSFYSNPHDPAIFVQKRIGFGYTLNFGNRVSWVIMGCLLLIIVGSLVATLY